MDNLVLEFKWDKEKTSAYLHKAIGLEIDFDWVCDVQKGRELQDSEKTLRVLGGLGLSFIMFLSFFGTFVMVIIAIFSLVYKNWGTSITFLISAIGCWWLFQYLYAYFNQKKEKLELLVFYALEEDILYKVIYFVNMPHKNSVEKIYLHGTIEMNLSPEFLKIQKGEQIWDIPSQYPQTLFNLIKTKLRPIN